MTRHRNFILDGNGNPVAAPDLLTWAAWCENADRHVAKDVVGDVLVSTVFLALDHSWGDGPPQLYETMIFGGQHDEYQERYATKEAALAGHDSALAMVRDSL